MFWLSEGRGCLHSMPSVKKMRKANGTMELAFHVPTFKDVDEEYTRVTALGAKSIFAPQTMPWGQRTCYIADPEGNLIEIHSFTKE